MSGVPPENEKPQQDQNDTDGTATEHLATDLISAAPEKKLATERVHKVQIGPYQIIRTLGEGGMGTVYLARQTEPVDRTVALKVIRGTLAGPVALGRFAAERQALARLSHLNVAQMFEAGTTDDDCPYFAMEHVDGLPITEYCDQHQLSIEQRLGLFIAVCAGVQHAHQRGIIHRDLKPTNILVHDVDGVPIAKVIDFGIAKALDGSLTSGSNLTGAGSVGTPSYMSPESFHLDRGGVDIDTRTDVYALGVLLYELLAGMRPFERRDMSIPQLLKMIHETDALKPSTRFASAPADERAAIAKQRSLSADELQRRLKVDLDWICSQALSRQRDERYASVSDLAADVARHLADQPVLASPPSYGYRARKFVRRHQAGVAIASVGLVLLVAFAFAMAFQAARIAAERDRANQESAARGAVSLFLTDLFKASDPSEARGDTITARELLDRGAEKIDKGLTDQPMIQAELMETIGVLYRELDFPEQAESLLQRALASRSQLLGETHPDTLRAHANLASVINMRNTRTDEAAAMYEALAEVSVRVLPEDDPLIAQIIGALGRIYVAQGRYPEAERALLDSVGRYRRLQASAHPGAADATRALSNLAELYFYQGRYDEALSLYSETRELSSQTLGSDHPQSISAMNGIAAVRFSQGDYDQAVALYQQILILSQRIFGDEHLRTNTTSVSLAAALQLQGEWEQALALYEHNAVIATRALGADNFNTLTNANNLADLYDARGRYEESEPLRLELIENYTRLIGRDRRSTQHAISGLAKLHALQGKYPQAAVALEESLKTTESIPGVSPVDLLDKMDALADAYRELGRYDEAEALIRRAWQLRQQEWGDEHRDALRSMQHLATLLMNRGSLEQAEPMQREVLALRQRTLGDESWDTLNSMTALGALLVQIGRCDEARGLLEHSFATASKLKTDVRSALAVFHYNLASFASACGEPMDAMESLRTAQSLGWKTNWIRLDQTLEPLRRIPGFSALAAEISGEL